MRPESHGGNKATILHESFGEKARLNVNDLLQKRQQEKDIDKKNNILIFSGAAAVAVLVLAVLSL